MFSGLHFGRATARHAVLGLALVAADITTTPSAEAELNLNWDAPPGCPGQDDVVHRIRALAGSSLDRAAGLSAEGRIARAGGRFWLTLLVRERAGVRKRVIASDSCADLACGGAAYLSFYASLGHSAERSNRSS